MFYILRHLHDGENLPGASRADLQENAGQAEEVIGWATECAGCLANGGGQCEKLGVFGAALRVQGKIPAVHAEGVDGQSEIGHRADRLLLGAAILFG